MGKKLIPMVLTCDAVVALTAQSLRLCQGVEKVCISGKNPLAIGHAFAYTIFNTATTPLNDALPRWLFCCPSLWRAT